MPALANATGGSTRDAFHSASTQFSFRAVRQDGTVETGIVRAVDRNAAAAMVTSRGLYLLRMTADSSTSDIGAGLRSRLNAPAAKDIALGLRSLATLLDAGLSIARALEALGNVAPPRLRDFLPAIIRDVKEGHSFSTALRQSPLRLPEVVLGIIQAGEASGKLSNSVGRAADFCEQQAVAAAALRAALAYPAMLALVGIASCSVLVGVVLPRFALLLADLNVDLPSSTRTLLAFSALVRSLGLPVLAIAALVAIGLSRAIATDSGRLRWHELLLSVPVVGPFRRSSSTARVCLAAAELLSSGVPLSAALPYAARASGDACITHRVRAARERIVEGMSIGRALDESGALTPLATRLIQTGEKSGRLAPMLSHAASIEARGAEAKLSNVVKFVEPALIMTFGGLIALVAAAMLEAVYSLRVGA